MLPTMKWSIQGSIFTAHPTFLLDCQALKMEAVCSSETSVTTYQSTWSNIPEDLELCKYCCEHLKSHNNELKNPTPSSYLPTFSGQCPCCSAFYPLHHTGEIRRDLSCTNSVSILDTFTVSLHVLTGKDKTIRQLQSLPVTYANRMTAFKSAEISVWLDWSIFVCFNVYTPKRGIQSVYIIN